VVEPVTEPVEPVIEPVEISLVHDEGLDPAAPALERRAVRAVARRGDEILLMATSSGAWKFPGGGVEDGESDETALGREVDEECGLTVTSVDGYVGEVVERSAAHPDDPLPVFVQVSRYYACTLGDGSGVTTLSAGERALGLVATWVDLDRAVADNRARVDGPHRFVRRELVVLEHLASAPDPGRA
jgi:8-oxo-dGTP pyrophosphatase MutT (NUDIX family)